MAMVISGRAKGMIGAFICLILLSAALVTASTKGWLFGLNKNNGEHVAARIQVIGDHALVEILNRAPPQYCKLQLMTDSNDRSLSTCYVSK